MEETDKTLFELDSSVGCDNWLGVQGDSFLPTSPALAREATGADDEVIAVHKID
jgi:hypothetical protein